MSTASLWITPCWTMLDMLDMLDTVGHSGARLGAPNTTESNKKVFIGLVCEDGE